MLNIISIREYQVERLRFTRSCYLCLEVLGQNPLFISSCLSSNTQSEGHIYESKELACALRDLEQPTQVRTQMRSLEQSKETRAFHLSTGGGPRSHLSGYFDRGTERHHPDKPLRRRLDKHVLRRFLCESTLAMSGLPPNVAVETFRIRYDTWTYLPLYDNRKDRTVYQPRKNSPIAIGRENIFQHDSLLGAYFIHSAPQTRPLLFLSRQNMVHSSEYRIYSRRPPWWVAHRRFLHILLLRNFLCAYLCLVAKRGSASRQTSRAQLSAATPSTGNAFSATVLWWRLRRGEGR